MDYWGALQKSVDDGELIEDAIARILGVTIEELEDMVRTHNYFNTVSTWGLLPKSQIDDETIEAAINRLILAHSADETAHLGVGESLQSHKASEIIDHLAESIISDKIKAFSVLPAHISTDKVQIWPGFESLDCWSKVGAGTMMLYLGCIALASGSTANNYCLMTALALNDSINLGVGNPVFECVLRLRATTDEISYWGIGKAGVNFVGFIFQAGVLSSCVSRDAANYSIEIPDIDVTLYHTYRCVSTDGEKVEFYIDDVLVATESVHVLPDMPVSQSFEFMIMTTVASHKFMDISDVRLYKDQ